MCAHILNILNILDSNFFITKIYVCIFYKTLIQCKFFNTKDINMIFLIQKLSMSQSKTLLFVILKSYTVYNMMFKYYYDEVPT